MSLRQFRKPPTTTNPSNGESLNGDLQNVPGKKRIQMMADSGSDTESSPGNSDPLQTTKSESTPPAPLTVPQKEFRLRAIKSAHPEYDSMSVQEALVRNAWDVEKAKEYLKAHEKVHTKRKIIVSPAPSAAQNPLQNGSSPSPVVNPAKKRKKRRNGSESDNDSERPQEKVFDSDDESDDGDYRGHMSRDRKTVFEFLNKATINELTSVKTLSLKKAEVLMENRPFRHWDDLVNKLKNHKSLQTEVLNYCQEYLSRRNSLVTIMKKCNKMVNRLEAAIAVGGGLLEQPSNIAEGFKLADYQLVGLNWLAVMHKNDMNGILADEMGLGKTIQVIAFLAHLKENGLSSLPHLVVVPSSTLDNWDNEIKKWCPSLDVVRYYGNQEDRKMMRIEWAKNGLVGIDVVLTTYHMMGASGEEKKMFRVTPFHYVIFDEAHMLKNMTTQRYTNLLRIRSEYRLLLTGTPLQNNLLELMSLLCFVMPALFASKAEDIKSLFQQTKAKTKSDNPETSFEQEQIERAKKIMKPFILRRLKKDVLSFLPDKTEHITKCPMLDSQKEKYLSFVQDYQSETGVVKPTTEISGMSIMMDMRKLANHPLLLRYYFTDEDVRKMAKKLATDIEWKGSKNVNEIFEDIAYLSDFKLLKLAEKYSSLFDVKIPDQLIVGSGKFRELDTLLPKLKAEGHRVLIFSQFVMMLDILEHYLGIRKYGYLRLDGQTVVNERQEMIDLYTTDPNIFIFLLSTKAGGLGINLTAADTVIIHDIDFNPYNDKQAEDRAHRMGQTKPVTIYKLVSDGTIEVGMLMIAQDKLQLEKDVTEEGDEAKEEHKCMVRLLSMSLGMDKNKAESILQSPSPKKRTDEDF